jgi:hypothetical protein
MCFGVTQVYERIVRLEVCHRRLGSIIAFKYVPIQDVCREGGPRSKG